MEDDTSTQPIEPVTDSHSEAREAPKQSTRFMFTAWHQHMPWGWHPRDWEIPGMTILYKAWGEHVCPSTHRQHWHIYIRFSRRVYFSALKKKIDPTMNITECMGTESQCRDYMWCQGKHEDKRDQRVTWGERGNFLPDAGKKGKRNDLEEIASKLAAGNAVKDIAVEHGASFIRYHGGIEALARQIQPPPQTSREVTTYVLHGPTGTGKTHRVLVGYPDAFVVLPGRNPWDEYSGQSVILFDEFRSQDWTITYMNKYLDKWRMTLACRYRNSWAAWTTVFICTNDNPVQFYPDEPNPLMRQAFFRRIASSCRYVGTREDMGGPSLQELIEAPPSPQI